ncbi:MAG TPA: MFS transporter [Natronosporangium sp.]
MDGLPDPPAAPDPRAVSDPPRGSAPSRRRAGRPPLLSPALLCVFAASLAGMTGFYLLLSVVPRYASDGGAGKVGAGATTAALLLSTVAAELAAPRVIARWGYRSTFGAGLFLLGAPALLLPLSSGLPLILGVSLVRGLGFGLVVVLGSALVAELVPPDRRGEGLGVFGVVIGVPGVLALPSGVFLVDQVGYPAVLAAGGIAALVGLPAVAGVPARPGGAGGDAPGGGSGGQRPVGIGSVVRAPELMWPAVVFAATATAGGIVVTFVPLAVPTASGLAPAALLVQATAAVVGRWWAGWYGDRVGPDRLILPGLVVSVVGILSLVMVPAAVPVLAAAVLFGTSFGAMQTASLALMFNRAGAERYGAVSALWNIAFDAAMGVGAMGFGVVANAAGYPAAFATTATLMLLAVLPAWRDRARGVV